MARPSRTLANVREKAAGNVIYIDDRLSRRSEDFDRLIVQTWKQHLAGAYDWDTAGRRHHTLVEQRDGRPVR
jgi:hypothetical protein